MDVLVSNMRVQYRKRKETRNIAFKYAIILLKTLELGK